MHFFVVKLLSIQWRSQGGNGCMPAGVPPSFRNLAFVSGFWGLRFQIPTKALPLDPAGDFRPPDLLFGPLSEIPGYALVMTYSYRTSITSEILRPANLLHTERINVSMRQQPDCS